MNASKFSQKLKPQNQGIQTTQYSDFERKII